MPEDEQRRGGACGNRREYGETNCGASQQPIRVFGDLTVVAGWGTSGDGG